MKRFRKILVGVDLSWGDCFVSEELSAPNAEVVRQALWLAQLNSATIDFFFSLDLSEKAQRLISQSSTHESTVLGEAEDRLAELVAQAREAGVAAHSHVVFGKSWLELIRHVLRQHHDLVMVGTRHLGAVQGFFMGSTSIKILRKCPCAVWVTQPPADKEFDSILVAHDLRTVGDLAMELGCSMSKLQNAQLHVLHAAEHPEFDYMFPARVSTERKQAYHDEATKHVETQLARAAWPLPAKMHFVVEPPDAAIMKCIEQYNIDLLVMGTVGHTGIKGFITGNTAERILPRIPCSLLAVKPPGFKSPVALELQA
jgi:universal stress protein E